MLYLIAALLCVALARHPQRRVWWAIAVVLLLLGLSRLANFEQIATDFGRGVAIRYGWYGTRRPVQSMGIFGILFGSLVIATYTLARYQRLRAPEAAGLLAVGCLLTLIGVRSISLHSVDSILDRHLFGLFGVQIEWLLELLLLICIVAASFWSALYARAASQNRSAD